MAESYPNVMFFTACFHVVLSVTPTFDCGDASEEYVFTNNIPIK